MCWGCISPGPRAQRHNPRGGGLTSNTDVQAVQGFQAADFTARKHRPLVTQTHTEAYANPRTSKINMTADKILGVM